MTAPQALRQTTTDLSTAAARLVDASRAMRHVRALATRAAAGDAKVFITGESGVGKDVVAQYIHAHSTRAVAALHRRQLRGNCRQSPRNGALRPCARQLHRRLSRPHGPPRGGASRDDLPRRNRRDEPADAGSPAAVPRERRDSAGREPGRADPRRRADHLGHQPRPRAARGHGRFSKRSALPHQGRAHPRAAAARPEGRPPDAHRGGGHANRPSDSVHRVRTPGALSLPLAGQRPRAPERHRAGGLDVRVAGRRRRRIFRKPSGLLQPTA